MNTVTDNGHITLDAPRTFLSERARLVPIRTNELLQAVVEAAKRDDHLVIAPTHAMLRGNDVIGYLSIGGLPVVQSWFDSKSGHAADSLKMIETGEAIFASNGGGNYAVAVSDDSPFTPHMERLGFTKLGATTLWFKRIT